MIVPEEQVTQIWLDTQSMLDGHMQYQGGEKTSRLVD